MQAVKHSLHQSTFFLHAGAGALLPATLQPTLTINPTAGAPVAPDTAAQLQTARSAPPVTAVRLQVCLRLCSCVRNCVREYALVYVRMYLFTCVCTCVREYAIVYVRMYLCT